MTLVHHELGCIQPLEAISSLCKSHGVALHIDAISAVGKIPPIGSHWLSHADSVAVAAHKIGAIVGTGVIATRRGFELAGSIVGGSQERGIRAGTPTTALAAAFAYAASHVNESLADYQALRPLRDSLQSGIERIGGVVNGIEPAMDDPATRAPHVCHVSFCGIRGGDLVAALDVEGVSVSSGAACSAGVAGPSEAMTHLFSKDRARAGGAIRISLPKTTTERDVRRALTVLEKVLSRGRPMAAQ